MTPIRILMPTDIKPDRMASKDHIPSLLENRLPRIIMESPVSKKASPNPNRRSNGISLWSMNLKKVQGFDFFIWLFVQFHVTCFRMSVLDFFFANLINIYRQLYNFIYLFSNILKFLIGSHVSNNDRKLSFFAFQDASLCLQDVSLGASGELRTPKGMSFGSNRQSSLVAFFVRQMFSRNTTQISERLSLDI